jgi:PAS domain S-box-containing protein
MDLQGEITRSHRCGARGLNRVAGLLVTWLMLVVISPSAVAETTVQGPPTVRVVLDNNYPPYSFGSDDGRLQGILVDQWQAWEKKTGIKVELHALDWAEALRRMRAGEFDVIDSIVKTDERLAYFDFTPAYATIEASIFFRKDISGITNFASLNGFPVGVKAGDQHIDVLEANGVTTLVPFQSFEAMVGAAKQRKINVFVIDVPSALYFLNKLGIENDFRRSAPMSQDGLRRAVRKGDGTVLRIVSQGFAAIGSSDLTQIDEKWFGTTIDHYGHYLAYAGCAVAVAFLLVAGLVVWNRTLTTRIQQRTIALLESEQRFRQIAENIDEVFWLATVDLSKILYVSPAYEVIWGRSRESLYQDQRSFMAAIHPADRALAVEAITKNREHGFEIEYRVVRPNGSVRWIRDRGFPIKDEVAHVYRIAGIAEDITERKLAIEVVKQAEDRIRLVIDTIPTLAWSVRANGTVDFVNQRWLDYTGLSSERELEDPTRALHPDDLSQVMVTWLADMAAGKSFEAEMRLRRADGEYRWFLVRSEPFRDEHGNIVKWFGVGSDIEDRKVAEELLQRRKRQLRALIERLHTAREEEAKRIARELHDDLGQQLTALSLQLDNLEFSHDDATPGKRTQFAAMHSVVNRTIEMVQTIASELRLGQLDVLGLTAAIDWQLQEFSRRSSIPCKVTRLDEIANLSDAQNTAVFRILQEALTNIVRHAGATKVEVSLQAGPEHLTLKIHDNGRGITTAELYDRKAIGLLGMRERAEIVGGTVTIGGGAGKGTTVLITIPLTQADQIPA